MEVTWMRSCEISRSITKYVCFADQNLIPSLRPVSHWMNEGRYFFGETYTTFFKNFHVVPAAWLTLGVDAFLLLLYAVWIPLTVGYFDMLCIVQLCISGSALSLACFGMWKDRHNCLWFLMLVKALQIVIYVLFMSFTCLLAIFNKNVLLRFISLRFRTITNSNAELHIVIVIFLLLLQMVYNFFAIQALYNVFDYFRHKNAFKYEQSRRMFFENTREFGWV
ncbi:unnamed protein product, partial [Mesorhabditis belari]|uniref:Uncharacterized protein n=1 Tax=Mesorhabditis belari TaxID=2138241 RepID=A0AAF3FL53_9BILA